MSTAKLRRIGGSVMVAIPPAVLQHLRLQSGATVEVVAEGERIAITPAPPRRYALSELLAEREAMTDASEGREWTRSKPVGRELL